MDISNLTMEELLEELKTRCGSMIFFGFPLSQKDETASAMMVHHPTDQAALGLVEIFKHWTLHNKVEMQPPGGGHGG